MKKRKEVVSIQARIQEIALKYARKWRAITQLRIRQRKQQRECFEFPQQQRMCAGDINSRQVWNSYPAGDKGIPIAEIATFRKDIFKYDGQAINEGIQQQSNTKTLKSQSYKPSGQEITRIASGKTLSPQMSFFPAPSNNKINGSLNNSNSFEGKEEIKRGYTGENKKSEEIIKWFEEDFKIKKRTIPIQRQYANNNTSNNDITEDFIKNLDFQQPQRLHQQQQQFQQNTQQQHYSTILQQFDLSGLLDEQQSSSSLVEIVRDKNNQLQDLLSQYTTLKEKGDTLAAARLKPTIQQKLLQIKQLRKFI